MSNQKKIGNNCERKVIDTLRSNNFFVYHCPSKVGGQPFDILAARTNTIVLIDAKHVENGKVSFSFERVEANQETAFQYCYDFAGLENSGFAIEFDRDEKIYWLPYLNYKVYKFCGKKSINKEELILFEEMIKQWKQ